MENNLIFKTFALTLLTVVLTSCATFKQKPVVKPEYRTVYEQKFIVSDVQIANIERPNFEEIAKQAYEAKDPIQRLTLIVRLVASQQKYIEQLEAVLNSIKTQPSDSANQDPKKPKDLKTNESVREEFVDQFD